MLRTSCLSCFTSVERDDEKLEICETPGVEAYELIMIRCEEHELIMTEHEGWTQPHTVNRNISTQQRWKDVCNMLHLKGLILQGVEREGWEIDIPGNPPSVFRSQMRVVWTLASCCGFAGWSD